LTAWVGSRKVANDVVALGIANAVS